MIKLLLMLQLSEANQKKIFLLYIKNSYLEIKMLIGNISYQISHEHYCNYNLILQKLEMLFNIENLIPK